MQLFVFFYFIRGHVYESNGSFPGGFMCFVAGKLLFRQNTADGAQGTKHFAEIIDTKTLLVSNTDLILLISLRVFQGQSHVTCDLIVRVYKASFAPYCF